MGQGRTQKQTELGVREACWAALLIVRARNDGG